jgi:hypothetical protein
MPCVVQPACTASGHLVALLSTFVGGRTAAVSMEGRGMGDVVCWQRAIGNLVDEMA